MFEAGTKVPDNQSDKDKANKLIEAAARVRSHEKTLSPYFQRDVDLSTAFTNTKMRRSLATDLLAAADDLLVVADFIGNYGKKDNASTQTEPSLRDVAKYFKKQAESIRSQPDRGISLDDISDLSTKVSGLQDLIDSIHVIRKNFELSAAGLESLGALGTEDQPGRAGEHRLKTNDVGVQVQEMSVAQVSKALQTLAEPPRSAEGEEIPVAHQSEKPKSTSGASYDRKGGTLTINRAGNSEVIQKAKEESEQDFFKKVLKSILQNFDYSTADLQVCSDQARIIIALSRGLTALHIDLGIQGEVQEILDEMKKKETASLDELKRKFVALQNKLNGEVSVVAVEDEEEVKERQSTFFAFLTTEALLFPADLDNASLDECRTSISALSELYERTLQAGTLLAYNDSDGNLVFATDTKVLGTNVAILSQVAANEQTTLHQLKGILTNMKSDNEKRKQRLQEIMSSETEHPVEKKNRFLNWGNDGALQIGSDQEVHTLEKRRGESDYAFFRRIATTLLHTRSIADDVKLTAYVELFELARERRILLGLPEQVQPALVDQLVLQLSQNPEISEERLEELLFNLPKWKILAEKLREQSEEPIIDVRLALFQTEDGKMLQTQLESLAAISSWRQKVVRYVDIVLELESRALSDPINIDELSNVLEQKYEQFSQKVMGWKELAKKASDKSEAKQLQKILARLSNDELEISRAEVIERLYAMHQPGAAQDMRSSENNQEQLHALGDVLEIFSTWKDQIAARGRYKSGPVRKKRKKASSDNVSIVAEKPMPAQESVIQATIAQFSTLRDRLITFSQGGNDIVQNPDHRVKFIRTLNEASQTITKFGFTEEIPTNTKVLLAQLNQDIMRLETQVKSIGNKKINNNELKQIFSTIRTSFDEIINELNTTVEDKNNI